MENLEILRKQLLSKAKEQVVEEFSSPEIQLVKAVNLLEDLDRIFNLMAEHCIEWYSVHFPELRETIEDNALILKLVAELGKRENFEEEVLVQLVGEEELSREIFQASKNSIGSELSEKDFAEVLELSVNALRLKKQREQLESYIQEKALGIAPNLSQIAGALLASRLLSKAGGLKRLAMLDSSKIQLLGAEKALFRHLKTKRKALPPKHGLILQHSFLQQLKPWQRSAMSRALAGKIAIAARIDFFSPKSRADGKLQDSLQAVFEKCQKIPEKPQRQFPVLERTRRPERKFFKKFNKRK